MRKVKALRNQKPEYRRQKRLFIWLLVTSAIGGFAFGGGYWLLVSSLSFAEDFVYNSKGKRDPFVPLVGPGATYQVKEIIDIHSIEDVVLEGIVYDDKGSSVAIINGMILKEGDQAGVVVVEKIESKKVILRIEENSYEVMLIKEKGGEGE